MPTNWTLSERISRDNAAAPALLALRDARHEAPEALVAAIRVTHELAKRSLP